MVYYRRRTRDTRQHCRRSCNEMDIHTAPSEVRSLHFPYRWPPWISTQFQHRTAHFIASMVGNARFLRLRRAVTSDAGSVCSLSLAQTGSRGDRPVQDLRLKPLRLAADLSADPGERPAICISAIPHRHSQHRGASDLSLCAAERDPVGSLLDGPADRLVRETLAFGSPSGNRLCSNHGDRDAWIRPALFIRSLAGCSVCDSGLSDMQSWLCCGQIGPPL